MLDPASLVILGTSAASLVSGFLVKSAEELGKKTVGAAWDKASEVVDFTKRKLSGEPRGQKALEALQASPNDPHAKAEIATTISEAASKDPLFATELSSKLVAASGSGVDNVFNTNIAGHVEKLIQVQVMHGNITM